MATALLVFLRKHSGAGLMQLPSVRDAIPTGQQAAEQHRHGRFSRAAPRAISGQQAAEQHRLGSRSRAAAQPWHREWYSLHLWWFGSPPCPLALAGGEGFLQFRRGLQPSVEMRSGCFLLHWMLPLLRPPSGAAAAVFIAAADAVVNAAVCACRRVTHSATVSASAKAGRWLRALEPLAEMAHARGDCKELRLVRADVRLQQANVIVAAPLDGTPVRLAVAAWWNTQQPFQQQLPPSQQQQLSQQQPRRNISTYNAAVVADMAHGRMRRNSITYSTAVWQEVVLLTRLVWVQVLWILQGDKRLQQVVAIVVASLDDAPVCVSVCLCVRGHWLLLQQPQRPQRQQRRGHQPRMHGAPSMFGCRWPHQDWQQWLQRLEHSRQQLLLGGAMFGVHYA